MFTRADIAQAIAERRPVVALETAVVSHGLPSPYNHRAIEQMQQAIAHGGAVPAVIGVYQGTVTVGLREDQIRSFAENPSEIVKASWRDLAVAAVQRRSAATTVAATIAIAHRSGIAVVATGGIGGVHRQAAQTWDVSADLQALARSPVLVVCSGPKNLVDLPKTLEYLETHAVPVVGYRTNEVPAFVVYSSKIGIEARADSPEEAAAIAQTHWALAGAGVVLVQPVPDSAAVEDAVWTEALEQAEREAVELDVRGKELTPFLLKRTAELSGGRTLDANVQLLRNNARLAAQVAVALADRRRNEK